MVTSTRLRNRLGLVYSLEDCGGMIHVSRKCVFCQNTYTVEADWNMFAFQRAWSTWIRGTLIQKAFPHMPDSDREFLVSAVCPMCFSACTPEEDP